MRVPKNLSLEGCENLYLKSEKLDLAKWKEITYVQPTPRGAHPSDPAAPLLVVLDATAWLNLN
jgi:hypothetical protein